MKRMRAITTTLLLAGAAIGTGGSASIEAAEMQAPVRLVVDLSERQLLVYHGGEVEATYDVAVGKRGNPTPTGNFRIGRVVWNPAWVPPPNARWAEDKTRKAPNHPENPMPGAKLFFREPDYYIHGTDAPETLGSAASHGCIRMRASDVMRLARLVQEHGGAERSEAWYAQARRNDATQHPVRLPRPSPNTIRR